MRDILNYDSRMLSRFYSCTTLENTFMKQGQYKCTTEHFFRQKYSLSVTEYSPYPYSCSALENTALFINMYKCTKTFVPEYSFFL